MKKKIVFILAAFCVGGSVVAGIAAYVYSRNFGPDYKGRARLDYNWKYLSSKTPGYEYKYSDEAISFSYHSFESKNPIRSSFGPGRGAVFFDDHFLDVLWYDAAPAAILSEINKFLSANAAVLPAPSLEFSQWLILEPDKEYLDFDRFYARTVEKVKLKSDGEGLIISFRSLIEQRPHKKFFVVVSPRGKVLKAVSVVRLNASESTYLEAMSSRGLFLGVSPDPARDAASAYIFDKFVKDFRFNQ